MPKTYCFCSRGMGQTDGRTKHVHHSLNPSSGVARISKLEHTGDVARKADTGMGFLGRGIGAGPLDQLGGLGESCHYPHPQQNLLGFARILWPCLSTVGGRGARASLCPRGYATVPLIGVARCKCTPRQSKKSIFKGNFGCAGRVGGWECLVQQF